MSADIIDHDFQELNVPQDYYSISLPKLEIIQSIKENLTKRNMSVRKLAEHMGVKHPQVIRVTSGENYNIETLLKILDVLGLEIVIKEKSEIQSEVDI